MVEMAGSHAGVVEIPHFGGRKMKVPGDRTFAEWTATFIADEKMQLHTDMEAWLQYVKASDYSQEDLAGSDTNDYQGTISVIHTDQSGSDLRTYNLENAFPTELAQLDLSYDNFDTIAESEQTMQLLEGSDGIIQQVAGKYSDYLRYAIIGVASLYATSVYKSEDEKSNYTNIAVPLGTLIIMQILATFFIDNAMTKALLVTISCAWFLLGFIANILPIIKA